MPKNDQIWPKIGIFGQYGPGHVGLFGALLAGRLVVVARGLYLARHLITLLLLEGSIGLEGSGCLVLAGRSYKLGSAANIVLQTLK